MAHTEVSPEKRQWRRETIPGWIHACQAIEGVCLITSIKRMGQPSRKPCRKRGRPCNHGWVGFKQLGKPEILVLGVFFSCAVPLPSLCGLLGSPAGAGHGWAGLSNPLLGVCREKGRSWRAFQQHGLSCQPGGAQPEGCRQAVSQIK